MNLGLDPLALSSWFIELFHPSLHQEVSHGRATVKTTVSFNSSISYHLSWVLHQLLTEIIHKAWNAVQSLEEEQGRKEKDVFTENTMAEHYGESQHFKRMWKL